MEITTREILEITSIIDEIIEDYNEKSETKERDWRTHEQRVAKRLQTVFRVLKPLVQKGVSTITITKGDNRGRNQS